MKKLDYWFSILLIGLISNACTKKVTNLHLPEQKDVPVMFGEVSTVRPVRVILTETYGVHEWNWGTDGRIRNATVSLWENGQFVENLQCSPDGIFLSSSPAVSGNSYTVKAVFSGGEELSGTTQVPDTVHTEITGQRFVSSFNGEVNENMLLIETDIKFYDDPATNDYYRVTAELDTGGYREPLYPVIPDDLPVDPSLVSGFGFDDGIYFSDGYFNGQSRTIPLYWNYYSDRQGSATLVLKIDRISKELYEYYKFASQADLETDNFGPGNYYDNLEGNVSGGIGMIGSFARNEKIVIVQ